VSGASANDPETTDAPADAVGRWARARVFVREHPYLVGLLVATTIGGAVFGALVPMGELGVVRRTIGGAIAGFYFGLFPLGFRLLD
jgi:hypothetical protein